MEQEREDVVRCLRADRHAARDRRRCCCTVVDLALDEDGNPHGVRSAAADSVVSEAAQRYLDALGKLFVARREAGGMLPQEDESRMRSFLERYREVLSMEEREQVDVMFPDWKEER